MNNNVNYFIDNTMRFESSTSVLTGFHPVDGKGGMLISYAVYTGGFRRLDENRR